VARAVVAIPVEIIPLIHGASKAMFPSDLKAANLPVMAMCVIGIGTAVILGRPTSTTAAPLPKEAAIKAMRERFQGTWKCVALHMQGMKSERDLTLTIKGDTWETRLDGQVYQSGTFKLVDLDASPRQIDWVMTSDALEEGNKGITLHGIFMLDGDSLCCVNSDAAVSTRPRVFFTEPGDGCFAAMYQRVDRPKDR
jgi:uncharacterized protein (TIGR03067 family)